MKLDIDKELDGIINAYEKLVGSINAKARESIEGRAYGGIVRAGKGKLVESIAKHLTEIAWISLGGSINNFDVRGGKFKVSFDRKYLERLDEELKTHILHNIDRYYYSQKADCQIYIKNNFVLGIECKAYTENAMLKRILVDFTLIKKKFPDLNCVLFQLESQLGGDYSEIFKAIKVGSYSTHTLLSFFDIDLIIVTLLGGERKVDKPIHNPKYFKKLKKKSVINALEVLQLILNQYV